MDSLTHLHFAYRLLQIVNGNTSAAVCSLFPQIDRIPAYFHRMYAHPYSQMGRLGEIGSCIFKHGTVPQRFQNTYEGDRFLADRARMQSFLGEFESDAGLPRTQFNPDSLSVTLAFVSHTYQDTFNNPIQAFLPYSVFPCAQWRLWTEIDPIHFRTRLYAPNNISAFRKEFFENSLWSTRLDGPSLVKAMIAQTALASVVPLPSEFVDSAYESLGITSGCEPGQMKEAEDFLREHESLLSILIRKYSDPGRKMARPVAS